MWGRAAPRPPAGFVYGCAPKVCRVGVGGRDLGHFRDVVSRKRTFSSHWFPTYLERKQLLMECEYIEDVALTGLVDLDLFATSVSDDGRGRVSAGGVASTTCVSPRLSTVRAAGCPRLARSRRGRESIASSFPILQWYDGNRHSLSIRVVTACM